MSVVDAVSSDISTLSYPRTGKRGVPQQFARRLYEMLQSEAKLALASPNKDVFISWSDSGLAFRILDVNGFTSQILPKYFRTKKFSSFQRNLNLVSRNTKTSGLMNEMANKESCHSPIVCPFLDVMNSMGSLRYDEVQILTCTHINPLFGVNLSCSYISENALQPRAER